MVTKPAAPLKSLLQIYCHVSCAGCQKLNHRKGGGVDREIELLIGVHAHFSLTNHTRQTEGALNIPFAARN